MKAATKCVCPSPLQQRISIHAAREGGDENGFTAMQETDISIHAAREGGDLPLLLPQQLRHYFNPRRP